MESTRAVYVQTIAFLVVVFAGFAAVLHSFATPAGREKLAGANSWAQIAGGQFTKAVDGEVAAALPKSERLDGLQAGLEYRIFDDAGPQVRAGCAGWLFLAEEFLEVRGGSDNMRARRAIVEKAAARLGERGIAVVLLPVPDKARMAPQALCGRRVSAQAQGRWAEWQRISADSHVPQVDVARGRPAQLGYWRTDTHWDRGGAKYAASVAAAEVNRILGGRGDERADVRTASVAEPRPGDLLRLSNLENAPRALQPAPDMDRSVTVSWRHGGGLLDSGPKASVILAGSSYSQNSGFAGELGLALGREVVQMSEPGGGFDGALLRVLAKPRESLEQAKVVVWEWPERSLTLPLTADERAFLEDPRK
jgi:alginate O-acetyltransferase complex protein AlgJ